MSKYLDNITNNKFKKFVKNSNSFNELQKKLGIKSRIKNDIFKQKIKDLEIDITHFNLTKISKQITKFNKILDEDFINIIKESFTYKEVKEKIDINFHENNIIQDRIEALNINIEHFNPSENYNPINKNFTNDEFIKIIKESFTYKEIRKKLKLTNSDNSIIKNKIEKLKINIEHLDCKKYITEKRTIPLDKILIKGDKYVNGNSIKTKLYKSGLKEEKCEKCNLGTTYNNKRIYFHLEHKNGINTDNRIENLEILCSSCHSQTDTFCRTKKSLENKKINNIESIKTTFEKLKINNKCNDCDIIINDDIQRCSKCYTNNILIKKFRKNKGDIWKYPENDFINLVKENYSLNSIKTNMKLNKNNGGQNITIRNRIDYLNLNISHFSHSKSMKKWIDENKTLSLEKILVENKTPSLEQNLVKKQTILFEKILVKNSKYKKGTEIKQKLYKAKLKEEKCELCGIGNIWNNKKLILQLDHINGVHSDNRIENLQIVCPNCHSCTENYCGRNVKLNNIKNGKNTKMYKQILLKHNCKNCDKKIRQEGNCIDCSKKLNRTKNKNMPSYNQLKEDIKVLPYTKIGIKYNVSDNCIRYWIKNYEKDINYYN